MAHIKIRVNAILWLTAEFHHAIVGASTERDMNHFTKYELERGEETFILEIDYITSPYDPGRTYGPPEDCYPPEGGEIEEIDITCNGKPFELTDAEMRELETWLYETTDYSDDRDYGEY